MPISPACDLSRQVFYAHYARYTKLQRPRQSPTLRETSSHPIAATASDLFQARGRWDRGKEGASAVTRSHAQSLCAAGELRASGWKAPDLHAGPGRAEDLDVDAGAVALAVEAWEAAQVLDQLGGDVVDQVGRHLEHEEDVLGAFLDEAQAGLLVGQVPGDDVARGLRVRALCDVVHLARLHLHRPATLTV